MTIGIPLGALALGATLATGLGSGFCKRRSTAHGSGARPTTRRAQQAAVSAAEQRRSPRTAIGLVDQAAAETRTGIDFRVD
jgi:hypothetical protein